LIRSCPAGATWCPGPAPSLLWPTSRRQTRPTWPRSNCPGVALEDLSVEVAGHRLTVTGERKERERVGILRRRTRTVGRLHYEVLLPGDIDEDAVEAALKDGVPPLGAEAGEPATPLHPVTQGPAN